MLLSCFLAFTLVAVQALDYDMSVQEKKETGVSKMSEKEKKALQDWIDNHYTKREAPLALVSTSNHPTLQDNLYNGRYILLTDNSIWEINPGDTAITLGWITPVEIIATQSGNVDYPYKLTNSLTGSSVRARRVSNVPKSTRSAPSQIPSSK